MLQELVTYAIRITPGLLLVSGCFALSRDRDPMLRIMTLIIGFVLIRDAMTPLGFWRFGSVGGLAPWLRFATDGALLVTLGTSTLLLTASLLRVSPGLGALVRWGRFDARTVIAGACGGVLAAAPVVLLWQWWPLAERGGAVATALLPALLFFCLAGNLAEEVLFRGFLQGHLEQQYSPARAALLSALLFAACHVFLASTVTDVGWPLLAFTLYEGLICAFLRMRWGVVPAALAHGVAIFVLSSGLF